MKKIAILCLLFFLQGCASTVGFFRGGEPIEEDHGKRTYGTVVEDEAIETKALVNIKNANKQFKRSRIVVVSYNGMVLLAGQVPTEELRQLAEKTILDIRKVRRVYNQLTVSSPISGLTKSNDAWLTTKIKSYMVATRDFESKRVKVVTEDSVVYLMGLVTPTQADQAVSIVQQIYGPKKIVKLFEYI